MANKFKWSEVELLNPEPVTTLETLLSDIVIQEVDADTATFDDMDFTIIEGFCPDCGAPFTWSGLFRDMPESFCDCKGRG